MNAIGFLTKHLLNPPPPLTTEGCSGSLVFLPAGRSLVFLPSALTTEHGPSEESGGKQLPSSHLRAHRTGPLLGCDATLHFLGRNPAFVRELRLPRPLVRAETQWQALSDYAAPPKNLARQEDPRRKPQHCCAPVAGQGWGAAGGGLRTHCRLLTCSGVPLFSKERMCCGPPLAIPPFYYKTLRPLRDRGTGPL